MKHACAWAISLALTFPTLLSAEGTTMTNDQQQVLAAIKHMTHSFEASDIGAVMDSYETPATVMFEPGVPVTEAGQLEAMFTGMAAINPKFDYAGHEVIVNGDTAVHIAPWKMTAQSPDGQEIKQQGLSVAVLRRQPDDSWRMVIDNPHGGRLLPPAD